MALIIDLEHPDSKFGPVIGLLPAARFWQPMLGAPSPRNRDLLPGMLGLGVLLLSAMAGVQISWFSAGFACRLSILASKTTCTKK